MVRQAGRGWLIGLSCDVAVAPCLAGRTNPRALQQGSITSLVACKGKQLDQRPRGLNMCASIACLVCPGASPHCSLPIHGIRRSHNTFRQQSLAADGLWTPPLPHTGFSIAGV